MYLSFDLFIKKTNQIFRKTITLVALQIEINVNRQISREIVQNLSEKNGQPLTSDFNMDIFISKYIERILHLYSTKILRYGYDYITDVDNRLIIVLLI